MKLAALALAVLAPCLQAAPALSPKQMAEAQNVEALTVPAPSEFFVALDRVLRPDWASFHREPGSTALPKRPQKAFTLGALLADAYIAVEAQDGQQVKNTGREIIALARALGVGEDVLARGRSIADFADKNDWFALREELEATTNEVRRAMAAQRDEALASLITTGAWVRALDVGGRAAARGGEDDHAPSLLAQADLIAFLHAQLQALPENSRSGSVVRRISAALESLQETMTTESGASLDVAQAEEIHQTSAKLVAELGDKGS